MSTLKDVAKDAGVSIATVSCCLSGSKPVKPETKARILDSIEKLKYIPNASARNLKTFDSRLIGVLLTDIDNLYHAEIFKGISSHLQAAGYSVSVAFSNNIPDLECQKIDDFISQNVVGLIIITCQPQNSVFFKERLLNYNIPTVFIERKPDDMYVNFVGFDNYQTTWHITNSLIQKGYRQIALVCGPPHFSSEHDSINGYMEALRQHGILVERDMICSTNMTKEDAFKSVLTTIRNQPLQAVISTSETIHAGTLEALKNRGLKVPENIQLITFSEESWNKSSRLPGVVHTSRTAFHLGVSACNLILESILSPILREETVLTFSDHIVDHDLDIPPASSLIPFKNFSADPGKGLRVLMMDIATPHSIELLSDYFTRKTGIPITYDYLPQNEILSCISDNIDSTGLSYDMYMYDVPWLSYMVQNSLLADLTDYITGNNFKRELFFQENMENCKCQDRYYGIPLVGGSQIMLYRKDLFENREIIKNFKDKYKISLRPPKTWTEFNGIAEFFTKSSNSSSPTEFGTSFAAITNEELAPELLIRLWAYGGVLWDQYHRPCLNTPENAKAFESILTTLNYVSSSPFETSIEKTVEDFSKGKTAMLITYTEYATQISQMLYKSIIGRIGYEIIPGRRPASIGWNLGLNPFSEKSDLVFQYFNWLCDPDTSFYLTILDGQSTAMAPYHSLELLKLYPWLEITEKSFAYAQKRTGPQKSNALVIPENKIEAILCNVLHQILEHNIPVQEALSTNQEAMRKLFLSYGYPKPQAR